MSHEIVKSIKIKDNKVFVKSACNNVRPLTFSEWESPSLTKILNENGLSAVEVAVLKEFETGNFSGSYVKKYDLALKVIHFVFTEEYANFNWNKMYFNKNEVEAKGVEEARNSPAFDSFLRKVLDYKPQKEFFVIQRNSFGTDYFGKRTFAHMKWLSSQIKATKYLFQKEAENELKNFPNTKDWIIKKVVE